MRKTLAVTEGLKLQKASGDGRSWGPRSLANGWRGNKVGGDTKKGRSYGTEAD